MAALDSVLFGKYQLCRILGTGRIGTVFLAVHLGLEEYRAVKRVPRSFHDYEHFRREALILKELRHPGIPIIYDIEEDGEYSYLIEEYLEGESLYDLVKRQGHLTQELAVCYGLQLTGIVKYLHSAGRNPILHLDLQPKNLILCGDSVKLIDFDSAAFRDETKDLEERYGTVGFAAPEQYEKDRTLDERTDIYAIGTILHYLCTGTFPHQPYEPIPAISPELSEIIGTCLEIKPELRFSTAQELEERLTSLEENGAVFKRSLQLPSLTIALVGSKRGAGTTHLAVGLSVYLRNSGFPNRYEEKNDTGMGAGLAAYTGAKPDHCGVMRYRSFVWIPAYGQSVRLPAPPEGLRVLDYGADAERAVYDRPHMVILVCDSRKWSFWEACEASAVLTESRLPYVVVYNHMHEKSRVKALPGLERKQCFRAPYFQEPFEVKGETRDFYAAVMKELAVRAGILETKRGRMRRLV